MLKKESLKTLLNIQGNFQDFLYLAQEASMPKCRHVNLKELTIAFICKPTTPCKEALPSIKHLAILCPNSNSRSLGSMENPLPKLTLLSKCQTIKNLTHCISMFQGAKLSRGPNPLILAATNPFKSLPMFQFSKHCNFLV